MYLIPEGTNRWVFFYNRRETAREMRVSRSRVRRFERDGILPPPTILGGTAHHGEPVVRRAQRRIKTLKKKAAALVRQSASIRRLIGSGRRHALAA